MSGISFSIRLIDMGALEGEIDANMMARLCDSLQEMATRVGRWVFGTQAVGRLPKDSEQITRVRFTSIGAGSTCLAFSTEPAESTLDGFTVDADEVDARLWGIVHGTASQQWRDDAPDAVRDSTAKWVNSLKPARLVEVSARSPKLDAAPARFSPIDVLRAPWFTASPAPTPALPQVVAGRLAMIDVARNRLRVDTPDGTSVEIRDLLDPLAVVPLVAQQVLVSGDAEPAARGSLMRGPSIESLGSPLAAAAAAEEDAFWRALETAAPYDPEQRMLVDLTPEELVAYWEVIDAR